MPQYTIRTILGVSALVGAYYYYDKNAVKAPVVRNETIQYASDRPIIVIKQSKTQEEQQYTIQEIRKQEPAIQSKAVAVPVPPIITEAQTPVLTKNIDKEKVVVAQREPEKPLTIIKKTEARFPENPFFDEQGRVKRRFFF
jgi:hypothetical protein